MQEALFSEGGLTDTRKLNNFFLFQMHLKVHVAVSRGFPKVKVLETAVSRGDIFMASSALIPHNTSR